MEKLSFTRKVIGELENAEGGSQMNTFFITGDINSDGLLDIVVSGRNGRMAWFENKGKEWERHLIDDVENQECGGVLYDLTGNGYPDVINGSDAGSDILSWWENPGTSEGKWVKRTIVKASKNKFHDMAIGDVTGDDRMSLVFWNQGAGSLHWVPLPKDPKVSPWPGIKTIANGMKENGIPEEGVAIADIDEDGRNEIVAGTHWYKYTGKKDNEWKVHRFARGYITTVIAIGDLDEDGRNEVVLSEGDPCIFGKPQGGKLAWFKPKDDIKSLWEEHLMEDFLLDAHSLQLGDICGNEHLDILVGEIGRPETYFEKKPKMIVFENDGMANFTRHVIDEGTGCHHARLADFRNKGVLDIASRPLHGPDKWKIFIWYNDRSGQVR